MIEIWACHLDYGGNYEFSNLGRIRRLPYYKDKYYKTGLVTRALWPGKFLVGDKLSAKGYKRVNIEGKAKFVHRLICEVFHGKSPEDKPQVNHIIGDKNNNRADNLEWVSNQENRDHAVANNLHPNRSNGFCIIPESEIPKIIERKKNGDIYKDIAKDYSVSKGTIASIIYKEKNRSV